MKTTIKQAAALPKHRAPTHPGDILRRLYLEPAGMSQAELSRRLNMPTNRINELIRGKRGMTPSTALGLAEVFDTTPQFWMNLQTNAELWEAEQKKLAYA